MLNRETGVAMDDQHEVHRNAYNAAFYELGLKWHWDMETYRSLLSHPDGRDRIFAYLQEHQSHLLKAYDADFLVRAIECAKANNFHNMAACSLSSLNWAELHRHEIGV